MQLPTYGQAKGQAGVTAASKVTVVTLDKKPCQDGLQLELESQRIRRQIGHDQEKKLTFAEAGQ